MASSSSYHTRSAATTTSDSIEINRHFCIVLTNNLRMLFKAQQELTVIRNRQGNALPSVHTRKLNDQQVPLSTQPIEEIMTATTTNKQQLHEEDIEDDFKAQVQQILQNYLNKTKRIPPINLFLDMTTLIQF